jgi:hypothetical protein
MSRNRRQLVAAVAALAVVVAFGWSSAGTDAPEHVTEVPTSIPVNGVDINTQVVLFPTAPGDVPGIDRSLAIDAASKQVLRSCTRAICKHGDKMLEPPTAILARVTVPGTIPPPDSPVPFDTIQDRLAWVVTFTSDKPQRVGVEKATSNVGDIPTPLLVTHYSTVLDAGAGEFLIGFYTV